MSEWTEHRLGEVCSRLSSGSNITAKDIHGSGSFPVFGGNGIRGYAAEANFSGECAIIGRQGAYCGNVRYFIGEARMSEHAIVACAGPSHNTRFLAYLLSNMNLGSLSGQAAQPGLSVKVLAQQPIRMPSRNIQERISQILGAYDDLIEVNRRRIAVLEEMARGLFEEWFVRFRFPGHEAVPILDTPDGPLPEGWNYGPFTEVADVLSGGTPKKDKAEYWGGDIPFFTPRDAPSTAWTFDTLANVTVEGVANCNSKLYPENTVFITARGTVGKVALAAVPMAMNQSCYALVGKGYPQRFLFGFTQWASARLQAMSNGAVFDTIIVDTFRKLKLPIPPVALARAYEDKATPILEMSRVVSASNQRLAASRDLLLPRLISGQLSVAEATRELEEAA